ncbi:MAG: zf-HC2 domain-containing protein [Mycobacterium sp.]
MTLVDRYSQWDASYVLGALSSDERREYEGHLAICGTCRSAVTELSGVPALLALLDRDCVTDDEPAAEVLPPMLDSLLATIRRRRRHSSWMIAALSVAAAVVSAGLVVVLWPQPAKPSLDLVAVAPSSYSANMTMTEYEWGTQIAMECTYTENHADNNGEAAAAADDDDDGGGGDELALVTIGDDGTRTRLATWRASAGGTAAPQASTSLGMDQIAAVQVVSADSGEVYLERTLEG